MDDTDNSKIRNNPSMNEMRKQLYGAQIMGGVVRFLNKIGIVKKETVEIFDKLDSVKNQFDEISELPDRFNTHFLPRGWIIYDSLNVNLVREAVALADAGKVDEAESLLINHYNENTIRLAFLIFRHIEPFRIRQELLQKARDDYLAGRYYASVLVVLTCIDGMANDVGKIKGFFSEGVDLTLLNTFVGHPSALPQLAKLLGNSRNRTSSEEITIPFRNGILHGRDLSYDTKIVAAKTWAALFAICDWAAHIKKGPNKPEPKRTIRELLQQIKENRDEKIRLDTWVARDIQIGRDIPFNGSSEIYNPSTPEFALVRFFELWSQHNYGEMVRWLSHLNKHKPYSHGKVAGQCRALFGNIVLTKWELLTVVDKAPAVTVIRVQLSYTPSKENNLKTRDFEVRLLFEKSDGNMVTRSSPQGSWKIIIAPFIGEFDDGFAKWNIYSK